MTSWSILSAAPALAFDNRVAPKGRYPPTPGTPKAGVGRGPQDGKLLGCFQAPNCFSSSASPEDDPDHYYPAWTYAGKTKEEAMADLVSLVKSYPPGQGGVDGGGWKIAAEQPGYLWVQYESAKRGYIDDLELAIVEDGKVLLRSSSRLGYLDFAVNARRVNWLAAQLPKASPGWTTAALTRKTHPVYFDQNEPGGGR